VELPQRLARRQEIRSAAFYGATLVPASGSRDSKGDAATADELFEFKHTERQSFGLRVTDFNRHRTAAVISGKRPVWEIEYTSPRGLTPQYVVCIDRDDYLEMREDAWRYRELNR
jgi:hypothetical protein